MRNWNWGSWPWNPDTRDYSDVVVNAIQAMARGELTDTPPGSASSICRAAAQLTARVFGSVAVEGAGSARIDAHFLARAGLAAVYRGELFADVLVGNDAVTFDVALGVDEQLDRDRYRLELPPLRDSDSERLRIVDDPLHVVFNASPGLRACRYGALQMQPLAALEHSLGNEAAVIPNARLFARALGGGSATIAQEGADRYDLQMQRLSKGGLQWVEGQNFGQYAQLMDQAALVSAQSTESMGRRLGPEFSSAAPQVMLELAARAGVEVGWPPSMIYAQAAAGQGIQAGYRHWVASTVAPQLAVLESELRRVLGSDALTLALRVSSAPLTSRLRRAPPPP